ncbi:MAG: 2-C-methyl-D-erythritol 2,4-cyclodiphosphate synthase [Nitrospirota bacterium]
MIRIGLGYDLHPLVGGRPLVLGGVTIPFARGLGGHSDADVLAHAICDALLGAAGLDDLGRQFPDSDPAYRNINSLALLEQVGRKVRQAGFRIGNIDSVIVAEAPKLAPHFDAMRAALAKTLEIDAARISVKAKRAEGVGAVGRGEGMAAQAVCLLEAARP